MAGKNGRSRSRGRGRSRSGKDSGLVWLAGAAAIVAIAIVAATGFSTSDHHPEPRAHVTHEHVHDADHYAAYPRVAQTYRLVAEIPNVIDGIYCYCACSDHSGHYSLLDCFRDAHAARCDVCLSEAVMAYRMHQDGESLDDIRAAIDRLYDT